MQSDYYDFSKIEKYFLKNDDLDVFQVISDKTSNDLDLQEVFQYIDNTHSKIGQQYLYSNLRTIPGTSNRINRLEKLISLFSSESGLKEFVIKQTSRLNRKEAYYISSLFNEKYLQKPKWFWVVKILSLLSLFLFCSLYIFPKLIILLVPVLVVNSLIHYWNKSNLYQYASCILQLLILNDVAKKIIKKSGLSEGKEDVRAAISMIDNIGYGMSLFKLEAKLESDIGLIVEHLLELVKSFFLIEPLNLFRVIKKLESKNEQVKVLFRYVGEIDASISIMLFREQLPYFCLPKVLDSGKHMKGENVYHPLVADCVANSIQLDNKSVLFTGSNMSGKTTFIRTIGINAITAQTLNTCFGREFVLPKVRVYSGIRISDDVLNERSYYAEELLTIKEMLTESRSDFQNLFLLDEIFKGTNTIERIAAGKSVLDYLTDGSNLVFVSSHDLELVDYLSDKYNCYHFTEVIENDKIIFDYTIKEGVLKATNAIRLLELNGYPAEIIFEARRVSGEISRNGRCQHEQCVTNIPR